MTTLDFITDTGLLLFVISVPIALISAILWYVFKSIFGKKK